MGTVRGDGEHRSISAVESSTILDQILYQCQKSNNAAVEFTKYSKVVRGMIVIKQYILVAVR